MTSNEFIHIERAFTNNLKGVSTNIPYNQITVITGVSGSGKSSLAFDTLYIEGRRRYIESLKSYTRGFLGQLPKPPVDKIDNLPPTIAIEQKKFSSNPRSTVGTVTEIYDYLKLLYAKMGVTISPLTNKEIKQHTADDVIKFITHLPIDTKLFVLAQSPSNTIDELKQQLNQWKLEGYTRLFYNNEIFTIDSFTPTQIKNNFQDVFLLIDRHILHNNSSSLPRIRDSIQNAFDEGKGYCALYYSSKEKSEMAHFSSLFEENGISYTQPSIHFFDFNNPIGQCPRCKGLGYISGIDESLVIPDKSLSVYEGAIACWQGKQMQKYHRDLVRNANKFNFPLHTPYNKLNAEEKLLLWRGNEYFMGLDNFFQMLNNNKSYKIQDRYLLTRFQGKSKCPDCGGTRLKKETEYVKINELNIAQVGSLSISDTLKWLHSIPQEQINKNGLSILYKELDNRLSYLQNVGLSYLTLNRTASTLSGGESQRLMLAKLLGSSLEDTLYVLDEPSIGLHPRDTNKLIKVLQKLRDLHNTIVIVEHDEEIIASADFIINMGPKAGSEGGYITYQGKTLKNYLTPPPIIQRRPSIFSITLNNIAENNLKEISVTFPLQVLTVVSGVSGSGKSTLIEDVLFPLLTNYLSSSYKGTKNFNSKQLHGDIDKIDEIVLVNQSLVGMSSRSNPATYTKVFDDIRNLFASQGLAKQLGFSASLFSFNSPGGRCEYCKGEGKITFEMQFLANISLTCDHCNGKRFTKDILEIKYQNKSIYDVLEMTIDEAIAFFSSNNKNTTIVDKLKPLQDVGIGYLKLGQPIGDLSGGERQRLKIASFLKDKNKNHVLFLFDEPTTGLANSDIEVLLKAFDKLIQKGHSLIVIEHNPRIIWAADYLIDLGPEGGENGGYVTFTGTPDNIINQKNNYTGRFLKQYLNRNKNNVHPNPI